MTTAMQAGEHFLGVVAHEIRTPVTTIYIGSRLLVGTSLDAATRRTVTLAVAAEAERLRRLVDDLLVLARLEAGSLELEQVPVAIARTTLARIHQEPAGGAIPRITFRGPRDIAADSADPESVSHVIRNLLDNAVRASRPRALVQVVVEGSSDEVAVRVLDRGPFGGRGGPGAFEISDSPPATAAQRAGGGIGLLVVSRLVSAMGGRVWALPRVGGGSEFGFALPRAQA